MLRWESSECGCSVSDVSCFDVISVAKKEMQGADTVCSVSYMKGSVLQTVHSCRLHMESVFHVFVWQYLLIVCTDTKGIFVDTKGISFMGSLGFTPVHLQPPARWTQGWTSGDIPVWVVLHAKLCYQRWDIPRGREAVLLVGIYSPLTCVTFPVQMSICPQTTSKACAFRRSGCSSLFLRTPHLQIPRTLLLCVSELGTLFC